jgi:hypothetical protein
MNGYHTLSDHITDQGGFWRAFRGKAFDFAVRWVGLILLIGGRRVVDNTTSFETATQVTSSITDVQLSEARSWTPARLKCSPHFVHLLGLSETSVVLKPVDRQTEFGIT